MPENKPEIGSIGWIDLTVTDADKVRDFYSKVTGWKPEPLSMGDYNDYVMNTPDTGRGVAGICNARGSNADFPSKWLIYISVVNLDESAKSCTELGGKILIPAKEMVNYGRYCVIEDPAGAVCALFESRQ